MKKINFFNFICIIVLFDCTFSYTQNNSNSICSNLILSFDRTKKDTGEVGLINKLLVSNLSEKYFTKACNECNAYPDISMFNFTIQDIEKKTCHREWSKKMRFVRMLKVCVPRPGDFLEIYELFFEDEKMAQELNKVLEKKFYKRRVSTDAVVFYDWYCKGEKLLFFRYLNEGESDKYTNDFIKVIKLELK
jgi:hypothetical protein